MFKFFKDKTDYLEKTIKYLEDIGYNKVDKPLTEPIPQQLYRESKFSISRLKNNTIKKQIEIVTTSKNTIASFQILNFNHQRTEHQYCDPSLATTLSRISKKNFNHFEVFGFKEFGKKQYKKLINLLEENHKYLTTKIDLPIGNLDIYPGFSDLCNVKENLNQVMFEYNYELIQDSSKFDPIFTKPEFWYQKNQQIIKFVRRKSQDENYIYAVKNDDRIEKNIFHYGTYEVGKKFRESEWKTIKERLRTTLDKT